jgi:SAM-dependent methyltransferase
MSTRVRRLFDAMAPAYEELEPWYEHLYAVVHAILRRAIGPTPGAGARALDAGCGTGFQARVLDELGWRAHGLDLSGGLLAVARDRLPGAAFAQGALEALPYADASFEAVVCCGSTLSFVDAPARALGEMARVLRPGGRLLLECEHRPSLDLAWALGSALLGDPLGYGTSARDVWRATTTRDGAGLPYPGYGRLRLFTARELRAMLSAAGLTPVRGWGVHAVTNVIPSTLLHRPRLPRGLVTLYRALCRLDAALASRGPARALANSLVLLARRNQPSA